jgi:hypothetical protein
VIKPRKPPLGVTALHPANTAGQANNNVILTLRKAASNMPPADPDGP